MARIESRIVSLATELRDRLSATPGLTVHDLGERRSGIVTFLRSGEAAAATVARLAERRISVSLSRPEHARLDLGARGLDGLVRASLHAFNTSEEVETLARAAAD
jgi:selenocysteine lyase/cysteine desulfurase